MIGNKNTRQNEDTGERPKEDVENLTSKFKYK